MKFDVIGRINNMRLPDGKTAILYSVYEAVSNSIHAINDRFKEEHAAARGKVDVNIDVDENGDVTLTARKSLNDTQFLSCLDPSRTYALAAFCAASNTSRADVVPATCSVSTCTNVFECRANAVPRHQSL